MEGHQGHEEEDHASAGEVGLCLGNHLAETRNFREEVLAYCLAAFAGITAARSGTADIATANRCTITASCSLSHMSFSRLTAGYSDMTDSLDSGSTSAADYCLTATSWDPFLLLIVLFQ